jgi:hypothetical protein
VRPAENERLAFPESQPLVEPNRPGIVAQHVQVQAIQIEFTESDLNQPPHDDLAQPPAPPRGIPDQDPHQRGMPGLGIDPSDLCVPDHLAGRDDREQQSWIPEELLELAAVQRMTEAWTGPLEQSLGGGRPGDELIEMLRPERNEFDPA